MNMKGIFLVLFLGFSGLKTGIQATKTTTALPISRSSMISSPERTNGSTPQPPTPETEPINGSTPQPPTPETEPTYNGSTPQPPTPETEPIRYTTKTPITFRPTYRYTTKRPTTLRPTQWDERPSWYLGDSYMRCYTCIIASSKKECLSRTSFCRGHCFSGMATLKKSNRTYYFAGCLDRFSPPGHYYCNWMCDRAVDRGLVLRSHCSTTCCEGDLCNRKDLMPSRQTTDGVFPTTKPIVRPSRQSTDGVSPITKPSAKDIEYRVTMKLTNVKWKDDFSNPRTAAYRKLANRIITQVKTLYHKRRNDLSSMAFKRVQIIGLRRGSVIVDMNITFAANIVNNTNVMQNIKDAVNNSTLGNISVDPNSLKILGPQTVQPSGGDSNAQPKGRGLSTKAKVGIAVAVIVVVGISLVLAWVWIKKKKSTNMDMSQPTFNNPLEFSPIPHNLDASNPKPSA